MIQTVLKALVAISAHLGGIAPVERAAIRWLGYSPRAFASSRRAGLPYIPTLVLTTIGRGSGELRSNALFFVRDGGDVIVVASSAGAAVHPSWFRNLEANPQAWVDVDRRHVPVRAEVLDDADRARVWPALVTMWPRYDDHVRHAAPRVIPVVRLRPNAPR